MQAFSYYNKPESEEQTLPNKNNSKTPARSITKTASPSMSSPGAVSQPERQPHTPPPSEKGTSATDKATKRTATATVWIAVFTVVLAFVGACSLYEIYEGGNDTHNLAQAALAANRAWLAPNHILLASALEAGLPAHFQVQVSNPGREPALGVVYHINPRTVAYIPQTGVDEPNLGENNTCIGLEPRPADGLVVYPDAPGLNRWVPDNIGDTPENRQILANVLNRTNSLVIEGCMAYRTNGQKHKSLFRFFLRDVPGQPSFIADKPNVTGTRWLFNATLTGNEAN